MAPGLEKDTLDLVLSTIGGFAEAELPEKLLLQLDTDDEFPEEIVRRMLSEIGICGAQGHLGVGATQVVGGRGGARRSRRG